jgi:hypothetical protein
LTGSISCRTLDYEASATSLEPESPRRAEGPRSTGAGGRRLRCIHPSCCYERHTAWDRPGGLANRYAAGDLDVVIYSARKWARLAAGGNPAVPLVLFVPAAVRAGRRGRLLQ